MPKDLRALLHRAREGDVDLPLLTGLYESNRRHFERAIQLILETGARRIAVIGLSFKPGTDDPRESPMVELIERLIGKPRFVRACYPPAEGCAARRLIARHGHAHQHKSVAWPLD